MTEAWVAIEGFPDYDVSDMGRVRSRRRGPPRILTLHYSRRSPYASVVLRNDDCASRRRVPRLVANAFLGGHQPGRLVCHRDGDHGNNGVANLYWGTYSDNAYDAVRHGVHSTASRVDCPLGHPLSEPNLVPSNLLRGSRACLACSRARGNRQRHPELDFAAIASHHFALIIGGAAA